MRSSVARYMRPAVQGRLVTAEMPSVNAASHAGPESVRSLGGSGRRALLAPAAATGTSPRPSAEEDPDPESEREEESESESESEVPRPCIDVGGAGQPSLRGRGTAPPSGTRDKVVSGTRDKDLRYVALRARVAFTRSSITSLVSFFSA